MKDVAVARDPTAAKSPENYRKHFKKANRAVYMATGVWFEGSRMGLDQDLSKKWHRLIPEDYGKISEAPTDQQVLEKTRYGRVPYKGGDLLTVEIFEPGCYSAVIRTASAKRVIEASPLIAERYIAGQNVVLEGVAADHFDHWLACISPDTQAALPIRIQRLLANDQGRWFYHTQTASWNLRNSIFVLDLSVNLQNFTVVDMIMDFWRMAVHKEKDMLESFKKNAGNFYNPSAKNVIRMLDFDPNDVNLIWTAAKKADRIKSKQGSPIRKFWLSMLNTKGKDAVDKIHEDFDDYSEEFIQDCRVELATWSEPTECDETTQDLMSHTQPIPSRLSVVNIHTQDQDEWCAHYHYHDPIAGGCRNTLAVTMATAYSAKNGGNSPDPTSSHVKVTTIEGNTYIIQNHTKYSKKDVQKLPQHYLTWNWHKIRAVVDHRIITQGVIPNSDGDVLLRPIYFQSDDFMDKQGRFPNHADYCRQNPGPKNILEDDRDERDGNNSDESDNEPGHTNGGITKERPEAEEQYQSSSEGESDEHEDQHSVIQEMEVIQEAREEISAEVVGNLNEVKEMDHQEEKSEARRLKKANLGSHRSLAGNRAPSPKRFARAHRYHPY